MNDNKTVCLTGGAGFVGSAVARELLSSGFKVRALIRKESPRKNLEGLSLEIIEGDIKDHNSVLEVMRGVQYVFHVAADYRLWAPNPNDIIQNNVDGTRTVMMAALHAKIQKVIYTSSVATINIPLNKTVTDETEILHEKEAIGAYKKSKVLAEGVVSELVKKQGLPAIIVNPSTPIGPRDIRPTPTGRIIIEAALGRMPAFVDTGLNIVHVDDVARGHLQALVKGRIGERYILGGENMTLAEMLKKIANLTGRQGPFLRLPHYLLYPVAYASQITARISGKEPFATIDGLRMAKKHMYFSSKKAEQQLGYKVRSASIAIEDALQWFKSAGYI
ncbi:MAG: hopanoid-associated sugar epimerase [Hyphomicrobium sp.]